MRRWRLILLTIAVLGVAYLLHRFVPSQHNPLRPPDLNEPLGLATYGKLTELKYNEKICRQVLLDAGVEFEVRVADGAEPRCPLPETLQLKRSLTPYRGAPLRMTCHQMAALYTWERHVLRPQAEKIFDSPLRQIQTYGSFSCRNIAGTRTRSQHSFANAIDISGFVLEDGTEIRVRDHWRERSNKGKYLSRVHRRACHLFSVTLGPDYDAAHADHFHLDMGHAETCR
ncbi:MAG: extensin family protein [Henriciella sp.]|nr:extensin family protein [Henriciella sp.]